MQVGSTMMAVLHLQSLVTNDDRDLGRFLAREGEMKYGV